MKQILLLVFILLTTIGQAQTTYYYKLTRQIVNGQSSKNVTGGQFVSFTKNSQGNSAYYESNREGVQVNNSALKYKGYQDGIYTYQGNSYWGNNTYFCFSSDKSVLNVTTKMGDTYIYKKSIAPQNVVTCSLLRGTQRQSNGSGGIIPSIPQTGYSGNYNSGNIGGSPTKRQQKDPHNHKCFKCNETGRYTCPCHSTPTFGSKSYHQCSNCGQSHEVGTGLNPHRCKCNDCDGKGSK